MSDDQLERYQQLRALVEQGPDPATLDAYLAVHCRRCGAWLDPHEGGREGFCPPCHLYQLHQQPTRDAGTLVERLTQQGGDPAMAALLIDYLLTAPEHALYRFNAYHLAAHLGVSPRAFLALLAPAVITGLLTLQWELYCLACHFQRPAFPSLKEARGRQTCTNCHATYDAPLDEEIVVTFTLNEAIRPLGAMADDPPWRQMINEQYGRVLGHDLLTVQAFRTLFVNEPLPIRESFKIGRLALLFTDLGNSTALYARRGDPRAYQLVHAHFDLLTELIAQHGGAVVKTIGDAIMAAFPTSQLALATALHAQQAIRTFNQSQALEEPDCFQLRLGLHVGPCLAVTLNERLDYFGTTVNVAARLQRLAQPGEVLFSEAVFKELPEPDAFPLAQAGREQLTLRGLETEPLTLYRFRPT